MISIDRRGHVPLHQQVADQIRYEIATGQYSTGDRLPSTRALAERLGLSYHTVRAAYRLLETEGLISVRAGSGYRVRERHTAGKADRMELGATTLQDALRKLLGVGLDLEEIDDLYHEQVELLTQDVHAGKVLFASSSSELASVCAEQLSATLHRPVDPTTLSDLSRHQDADYVVAAYDHVRSAMENAPRSDVRGVSVHLNEDTLERVTRLLNEHTLCIVSRDDESIPPLVAAVQKETGFGGQIVASSVHVEPDRLERLIRQSTLVIFTPLARRPLLPHLRREMASTLVKPVISHTSLDAIRGVIS